jgi:hypothetical protein
VIRCAYTPNDSAVVFQSVQSNSPFLKSIPLVAYLAQGNHTASLPHHFQVCREADKAQVHHHPPVA